MGVYTHWNDLPTRLRAILEMDAFDHLCESERRRIMALNTDDPKYIQLIVIAKMKGLENGYLDEAALGSFKVKVSQKGWDAANG